jgi:hypothetical protein
MKTKKSEKSRINKSENSVKTPVQISNQDKGTEDLGKMKIGKAHSMGSDHPKISSRRMDK